MRLTRGSEDAPAPPERTRERPALSGTVLVAEDSPVNRELALRQLSRLGVGAQAVGTGTDAVRALEQDAYDAVLMDMRMPGMDGLEATRAIRARERETGSRHTPIIAVTANAMHGDRATCVAAGMDDFATKPLVLDDLAETLGRWLPAGAAAQEPPPAPERAEGSETRRINGQLTRLSDDLGSPEGARRVVQAWLEELPGRLQEARESLAQEDTEHLREVTHTLKSTCALVDAASATDLAAEIERLAAAGDPVDEQAVERLVAAAERAAEVVRAWLRESNSQEQAG